MFRKFFTWLKDIITRWSIHIKATSEDRKVKREEKRRERRLAEMRYQAKLAEERRRREAELERLRVEHEARVAEEKAAYTAKIKTPDGIRDELTKMLDKEINKLNSISNNLDRAASSLNWIDIPSFVKSDDDNSQTDYARINLKSKLGNIEDRITDSKSSVNGRIENLYAIKNLVNKITDVEFTSPNPTPNPAV